MYTHTRIHTERLLERLWRSTEPSPLLPIRCVCMHTHVHAYGIYTHTYTHTRACMYNHIRVHIECPGLDVYVEPTCTGVCKFMSDVQTYLGIHVAYAYSTYMLHMHIERQRPNEHSKVYKRCLTPTCAYTYTCTRLYKYTHMHMCIHIRTRALWRRTVTSDQCAGNAHQDLTPLSRCLRRMCYCGCTLGMEDTL